MSSVQDDGINESSRAQSLLHVPSMTKRFAPPGVLDVSLAMAEWHGSHFLYALGEFLTGLTEKPAAGWSRRLDDVLFWAPRIVGDGDHPCTDPRHDLLDLSGHDLPNVL